MKIAFFNWRDIKNPLAGGAEIYNHRILKELVKRGHKVTIFTSTFPGCINHEFIDGIEHTRYANRFFIYPKSYFCYKKHIQGKYDIIIEGINGVPFFTKLFAQEKVIPLIYQLTRKNWYSGLPFPFAFFGFHLEDSMLRVYKKEPTLTISNSTRADLEKLGFEHVTIIYAAADAIPPKKIIKEKNPTIIYLGRLTKSKQVDHVLHAFKLIAEHKKNTQLWIVGDGSEKQNLIKLAKKLSISTKTTFFGKVTQKKKTELLSKAHIMLFPAVHEGWGLTVLEANMCGTPVIGYNVHGLRDSIEDGVNGHLVENGDIATLTNSTLNLLQNTKNLNQLSIAAIKLSKKFTWSKTSKNFLSFLKGVIE
ncbi:glycosyltransferase family 4 protein [Patescibacteria group bacterium]|nr:glycosyltransferase family 4 protein [Candidatus Micrarchaeota archaeon]MBU1758371.1 glycosyltransferase family 4 protein [Patescibacteria group bacterium]